MESEVQNYGSVPTATCLLSRDGTQNQEVNPSSLTPNLVLYHKAKPLQKCTMAPCFEHPQVLTDASENHNNKKGKQNPYAEF